jgi:hypothetical protein
MLRAWFKRVWVIWVVVVANMIIFGPGSKYIVAWCGNSLDDIATLIFNLSSCFLALLGVDLLFDRRKEWGIFPDLDVDACHRRAKSPIAAAIVWLGYVILVAIILFICVPRAHGDMIDKAKPYLPKLTGSIDKHWPTLTVRHFLAGQVERESEWNTRATLKTSRELGRGLCQPTIAWDNKGKERFNAYKDAMAYKALRGWDWRNDPFNPGYQLQLLVLRDRDAFRQVRPFMINDEEAMKVMAVMFNAGEGRYLARKKYGQLHGFKVDRWSGGLELAHSPKEDMKLYGERLWEAVNRYPVTVWGMGQKYRGLV